jgi:protein subunit release factor B
LRYHPLQCRDFNISPCNHKKGNPQLPPRPTLPDADLKHVYLKGSGPGGQKINKTSSAVQLTHLPTGIVVKSQATRSQKQNHNIAKRILAEKIELMEKGDESRVAKKIEWKVRKKSSADKKKRRKYRKLADEKDGVDDGEDAEPEEVHDVVVGKSEGRKEASDLDKQNAPSNQM